MLQPDGFSSSAARKSNKFITDCTGRCKFFIVSNSSESGLNHRFLAISFDPQRLLSLTVKRCYGSDWQEG